ncbi:type II glyceraldehyde-3-phosphate dehydrogenase [Halalkalicoccus tibetensis]|uniref:Glyceraldehyde-3-phosphate dehydrogenase n=1 Tax=Halalkalicoccus tibetensis TaxID=175632 RepID=A0ABD5V5K5_9EURY
MLKVGINGYGTIGKRVADAVAAQPDMTVCGVAKASPDFGADGAVRRGYPLYSARDDRVNAFREAGYELAGTSDDLIAESEVVVDAAPGGIGAENLPRYEAAGVPAIVQGKESDDLVETSFNARANFEDAEGADAVRVVSCNTTGLSRLVAPLEENYGVEKVRATLVRRGGDPDQTGRGPINDILPDPIAVPSHHGPDVNTIFPELSIDTMGLKVPATLMHMHSLNIELGSDPSSEELRELLGGESRVFVVGDDFSIDGTGKLREFARDRGRPRGDLWENCVWGESITVKDSELYMFQAIHQESDVIPENVDAIRAMTGLADKEESMRITDEALGIGLPESRESSAVVSPV